MRPAPVQPDSDRLLDFVVVAVAVVLIIMVNAAFAFVQELQAERAVEALAEYLPQRAKVVRDGRPVEIDAAGLVRLLEGLAPLGHSGDVYARARARA